MPWVQVAMLRKHCRGLQTSQLGHYELVKSWICDALYDLWPFLKRDSTDRAASLAAESE